MPRRVGNCSECGEALSNPAAKTCTTKCRGARSRRIARQRKTNDKTRTSTQEQVGIAAVAAGEVKDVTREVMKEEIRPIVREALTEDVLRGASALVALIPAMTKAITEDLMQEEDPLLRQRAYTLLAKFTLGNQSIAPGPQEATAQPMQVVFQLPRPEGDPVVPEAPGPSLEHEDATELRQCVECLSDKPEGEFVGSSDRCTVCHEKLQDEVRARFGQ